MPFLHPKKPFTFAPPIKFGKIEDMTSLPLTKKVDYLIAQVAEIKELILPHIQKAEEIPKYLDTKQALTFLTKQGCQISKSKFYKMTASDEIPTRRTDKGKLYFVPNELAEWMKSKVTSHSQSCRESAIQRISKSALKKLKQ